MDGQMPCPHCGRPIDAAAKYCHYCGIGLGADQPAAGHLPPPPYPQPASQKNVGLIVCCAVAGGIALVVIIIGSLVAISLPNFIKIKDKAREAEVKQNCHAIQLALERYGVDAPDGAYPLVVMGGDWTDSYVVWQEWVDMQDSLGVGMIADQERRDGWLPASPDVGDALVMESYLPSYPGNPFVKQQPPSIPRIHHYPSPRTGVVPYWRIIGGRDSNKMIEVFGPVWLGPGQSVAGDYYVHHIFNDPPYYFEGDLYKDPAGGWSYPSGNELLTGNFSYWPRGEPGTAWSLGGGSTVTGYTLAGYGALRTAGQDVYNRNGNYQGRFRTEPCEVDCTADLYPDDIPCICDSGAAPGPDINDGGSDTIPDGVIVTLDSGLNRKVARSPVSVMDGGDAP